MAQAATDARGAVAQRLGFDGSKSARHHATPVPVARTLAPLARSAMATWRTLALAGSAHVVLMSDFLANGQQVAPGDAAPTAVR
jgi:hypothetical protein